MSIKTDERSIELIVDAPNEILFYADRCIIRELLSKAQRNLDILDCEIL
jgi:hypothetical protein